MRADVPEVRVVRGATPRLAPAPRRVPIMLALGLLTGGLIPQGGWLAFAVLFAMGGPVTPGTYLLGALPLACVLWGLWEGGHAIRLLRHGRETVGVLVSTSEPDAEGDVRLTFEFAVADGTRRRLTLLYSLSARLVDDAEEPIVYDPRDPDRATTIDHLPGSPRITRGGGISPGNARFLLYLILPALAVAAALGL